MIIEPRTGDGSARSASRTTAWYHCGNVLRLPVDRLTLKARCISLNCSRTAGPLRKDRAPRGLLVTGRFGSQIGVHKDAGDSMTAQDTIHAPERPAAGTRPGTRPFAFFEW